MTAPLARFHGERPPAPAWFAAALAQAPDRSFVPVEGVNIELLAWGERGRPGLLFLHGGRAHADWFSFIAPFFADDYRVGAVSMSGM
ncbi:MAG: alpha/beta fold hydrolase, partial [Caulobacteraceae bacterium]